MPSAYKSERHLGMQVHVAGASVKPGPGASFASKENGCHHLFHRDNILERDPMLSVTEKMVGEEAVRRLGKETNGPHIL